MSITYALIVTTICSFILFFFPHLVFVGGKPATKKIILLNTFLTYVVLYALAPTPYLYPLCILLSVVLGVLILMMLYFKVQNYFMRKNPSLIKQFENIDVMNGFEFEEFVGNILILKGYRDVKLTKKTGDFGVDAVCSPISPKDKRRIAIQIKRYSSPVSVGAVQEVVTGAAMYKAELKMVVTNSSFTNNAKLLAENNDCVLVDRIVLQNWLYETTKEHAKAKIKPLELIAVHHVSADTVSQDSSKHESGSFADLLLEDEVDNLLLMSQISHIINYVPPTAKNEPPIAPIKESEPAAVIDKTEDDAHESSADLTSETPQTTESTETVEEKVDSDSIDSSGTIELKNEKISSSANAPENDLSIDVSVDDMEMADIGIPQPSDEENIALEAVDEVLETSTSSIDDFDVPDL